MFPLLTSCGPNRPATSSCDYPAEITVGNSTKMLPSGSCAGYFWSTTAASVHISVGQVLTVHFGERGVASSRSLHPKVLELTAENSMGQRFQAVASGTSEILYSPPVGGLLVCTDGVTMAVPCVIAKITVTRSCAGKSVRSCNSSQKQATTTGKKTTSQITPSIAALNAAQSPLAVMCKPGFFTKAQDQLMVQQFGFIECFRFSGEDEWVVIGNGRAETSSPIASPSSPGGVIVALRRCTSSDTTCLSPGAIHNFANFTVYYPPHPLIDLPGGISATYYGNLLSMNDGKYCIPITFDMTNGHWYPKSANDHLLEDDPGSVQSLPASTPVSGTQALVQTPPPATTWSC